MKKNFVILLVMAICLGLLWVGDLLYKNFRGGGPALKSPAGNIADRIGEQPTQGVNKTDFPLKLAPAFAISVFAKEVPGARVMAVDGLGNMWVSQTQEGTVMLLEVKDGKVSHQQTIFKGLNKPHGLVVDPQDGLLLYIAEETRISKVRLYTEDTLHKIVDLPKGGRHTTRTIVFGPDDRLYVSIGSTCDVCYEQDQRHAAIYSMNKDGSDFKPVAKGLRNSMFFTWSYVDGRMWATDMGRDFLGDDLPPDEINIITGPSANSGQNPIPDFGWPVCYGNNVHDTKFDPEASRQGGSYGAGKNICEEKEPSYIDLPAHSAPLGLAFVPEEGWPQDYWYNLLVAFHGSWNRSVHTGYKIVRIKLNSKGEFQGMEDFISGWLASDGKTALGRPVDIVLQPGGIMYVSDDKAGVIYKVTYQNPQVQEPGSPDIVLNNLFDNQPIASPFTVEGQAKGSWFFEGTFPVTLLDEQEREIARTQTQTKENWMTDQLVSFSASLSFQKPSTGRGTVVFQKDNPSGLPENAGEFRVQVRFGTANTSPETGGCIVTGCSGQLCAEEATNTTCEFRPEYACYKAAKCIRLANGLCGWAPTVELETCLAKSR